MTYLLQQGWTIYASATSDQVFKCLSLSKTFSFKPSEHVRAPGSFGAESRIWKQPKAPLPGEWTNRLHETAFWRTVHNEKNKLTLSSQVKGVQLHSYQREQSKAVSLSREWFKKYNKNSNYIHCVYISHKHLSKFAILYLERWRYHTQFYFYCSNQS